MRYDLVVIGTGSGLDVANWAVGQGWRVALVEKGPAGGTCLNRGCIPSKMLIHAADVARQIRDAGKLGLRPQGFEVDFPALMGRVRAHVDGDSARIAEALRASGNPRYFEGEARFVANDAIEVDGARVEGDRFVLATGARPRIPAIEGLADVPFLTSTEALSIDHLPESLVIVGGGYIAAELGHFFGALGTRVSVVHRHPTMLNKEDDDVQEVFTRVFARHHEVHLSAHARRARREGDGIALDVDLADGSRRTLRAEHLLVAAGIVPNSDTLDLERAGVTTDGNGYIRADMELRTNVPGIWAFGDAVGRFPFKHNANHEARYVIQNMLRPDAPVTVDYHAMPHAIFSHPQVAGVGCTEQELRTAGVRYRVAKHAYADTGMGAALVEEDGFVKFLAEPESGRILGCHILGPEAATLLHEVLVAMRAGAGTLDDLAETIHVHPALNEVVQRAAMA